MVDIVTEILIAELHRQGLLDGAAIANMARRLEDAGETDAAGEVLGVVLGNALDAPEARQSILHVVPSGGNDTE